MSVLEPEKLGGNDGPKGKVLVRRFPLGLFERWLPKDALFHQCYTDCLSCRKLLLLVTCCSGKAKSFDWRKSIYNEDGVKREELSIVFMRKEERI